MDDLIGGIVYLILIIGPVNLVGIVRLMGFSNFSWGETKKILIVENIILILFFIGYHVFLLFQMRFLKKLLKY